MGSPARWYIDTALHMQIVCQIFKFKSFFLRFSSCVCVCVCAVGRVCCSSLFEGHVLLLKERDTYKQTNKRSYIYVNTLRMLDMSANACIRVYLCEWCMCVIHVLAIAPCANGKSEAGKRERAR